MYHIHCQYLIVEAIKTTNKIGKQNKELKEKI